MEVRRSHIQHLDWGSPVGLAVRVRVVCEIGVSSYSSQVFRKQRVYGSGLLYDGCEHVLLFCCVVMAAAGSGAVHQGRDVCWLAICKFAFWNKRAPLTYIQCTVASSTALGQICAGAIVKWGGNVRYWIIFSTFAMVGFVAALASLTPETKNTGIALTILGPFFVGFIELTSLALAPLFCNPADIGLASGLLASIRSAGGSIAVAVYSSILQNRLQTTLPANIGQAAIAAGLPSTQVPALVAAVKAGKLAAFPGMTAQLRNAVTRALPEAYAEAFKTVYLSSLGFGAIALVACLFAKYDQVLLSDEVARKMQKKNYTKFCDEKCTADV